MWLPQQAVRHTSGFRANPLLLTGATRMDRGLRDGDTVICTLVAAGLTYFVIEVEKNTHSSAVWG